MHLFFSDLMMSLGYIGKVLMYSYNKFFGVYPSFDDLIIHKEEVEKKFQLIAYLLSEYGCFPCLGSFIIDESTGIPYHNAVTRQCWILSQIVPELSKEEYNKQLLGTESNLDESEIFTQQDKDIITAISLAVQEYSRSMDFELLAGMEDLVIILFNRSKNSNINYAILPENTTSKLNLKFISNKMGLSRYKFCTSKDEFDYARNYLSNQYVKKK